MSSAVGPRSAPNLRRSEHQYETIWTQTKIADFAGRYVQDFYSGSCRMCAAY